LPERDLYLSNLLNINKNMKYLVVHRASWQEYLLVLQPDLVVPGKRTVLSVEPCPCRVQHYAFLLNNFGNVARSQNCNSDFLSVLASRSCTARRWVSRSRALYTYLAASGGPRGRAPRHRRLLSSRGGGQAARASIQ
jgi:hypothetical protein